MSGHCEHCDPERIDCRDTGEYGWIHTQPVWESDYTASWVSGHCPMCAAAKAERERIAAFCGECRKEDIQELRGAYILIAAYARGET